MICCGYFDTTQNGNHSSFLTPTVVGGRCPFPVKYSPKVTPFEKRRLRQISVHNVWTLKDSGKSSIITNRKSTTGFPMSCRWSAYVPLSPERVAQTATFSFLGILKRVIVTSAVYRRFFEFLYVDIHSTGRTLSRPWSRQPNDVMSEIECTQLHNELFGRRNSTLQPHGLFALAKHLSS